MPMPEPPKDLVPAEVDVIFPDVLNGSGNPMREFFFYDEDSDGDDAYVQAVKWLDAVKSGRYTVKVTSWTEPNRK